MSSISKWVLKWARPIILIICLLVVLWKIFISGDYSIVSNTKEISKSSLTTQIVDVKNVLVEEKDRLIIYGVLF